MNLRGYLVMDTSRFKNYGLWVSVCALVPMVFKAFGVDILPENYNDIVYAILSILVMAGILNNPTTNNKGFLDDKAEEIKENNEEIISQSQYDEITQKTIDRESSEGK